MKSYYRVMLGRKSVCAKECVAGNFIGADFDIRQDLSPRLPEDWRTFNREFIPIFLQLHPDKSRIAAGLACGALWTISKGICQGDTILSPDGENHYHVGEVIGDYTYEPKGILPHRRAVRWLSKTIDRAKMSDALRNSAGAMGTVGNITAHGSEIEALLDDGEPDEAIEDLAAFAMEKHLEDFLVHNWSQSVFAKEYDIYQEDGERGQQYPTDTGAIDILAISKNKQTLLVIELKKGRASDVVVGQILRYMGYVEAELAEEHQSVRGVIIALEDDQRIKRALAMVPSIEFYRYQISFKLSKA